MKTFNFPYHNVSTEYFPNETQSNSELKWTLFTKPKKGFTRKFTLRLSGIRFTDKHDGTNVSDLEAFYREHKTYKPFVYNHPVYGLLVCRFLSPLRLPDIATNGVYPPFDIFLEELYKFPVIKEDENFIDCNNDILVGNNGEYIVWR